MKTAPRWSSAGFTVTELMVTSLVVGLFISLGATLMIQFSKFMGISTARLITERDGKAALEQIVRDMREASLASLTIDSLAGQPPQSRVSFSLPNGATVTIYQEGQKLVRADGANVRILSNDLRLLTFTYPKYSDTTVINATLCLERTAGPGNKKLFQSVSEYIKIMNK